MAAGQVSILLSTLNGAAYLPAQLNSFAAQQQADWVLYWRDDGSSDGTPALVRAFAEGEGRGRCIEVAGQGAHLGIAASFLHLLRAAPRDSTIAFSDQDDVWLPGKLRRGLEALADVSPGRPALYCARQTLVDEKLRVLGLSPFRGPPPRFPAGLTQNVATGCTVMLNPAAAALIATAEAPHGTLHDWWSYLLVSAAAGVLIADPVPTVLYRQHTGNAVGAPHSSFRRGIMALRRGPNAFMSLFGRHVTAMLACQTHLSPGARRDLTVLDRALRGGFLLRLATLLRVGSLVRQTRLETILFRLWFLLG